MDTLQNMRVFMRVVETGSFTAAAQLMATTTAHVSRSISDLETHLRTRLLNRTTRRLALTEAGERYLHRCEQIVAYVDEAEAEARHAQARPAGTLRLHAMSSLARHYLMAAIARYHERYPEVFVDLTLSQRMPDLLEEGLDVSMIVSSQLPDSGLISQKLGESRTVVCASPRYLARRGTPASVADLANHDCVQLQSAAVVSTDRWPFTGPEGEQTVTVRGPLRVNSAESLRIALEDGMGIGLLPAFTALESLRDGSLVRLLPDFSLPALSVYALYPSRQYLDAKIRAWIELIRAEVTEAMIADDAELCSLPCARPGAIANAVAAYEAALDGAPPGAAVRARSGSRHRAAAMGAMMGATADMTTGTPAAAAESAPLETGTPQSSEASE
ncbi:LysR family transcriptional regulator [Pararobbsia silviterrae]|uniref:LysR family transcriptional regulator n=1 Tax=Pararobbsia silviterrae TaxID=1792498 RepID=A0A494XW45_9BURK|nr:LysR family transcriptional regulator [Pararobbsia silviterrae]